MEEVIKELINKAITRIQSKYQFEFEKNEIEVFLTGDDKLGDYTSNISFGLAKKILNNPLKIAEEITLLINSFPETNYYFQKVEATNGFVNFFLSFKVLEEEISDVLKSGSKYGQRKIFPRKTVVIDYSSPNIAKSFGIGHLRSTIIGQSLYNLYRFLGWKVIGDNHLGDWGTQFGKLIYQIENELLKGKNLKEKKEILESLTIDKLESLYVDFHSLVKDNPQLEEEARKWFKKLEEKDREALRIWKTCVNVSLKEFNRIYKLLDVKFDVSLGESFYEDKMKKVLEELKEKNLIEESQNALIINFKGKLPPVLVLKSDKATTYFLRDLATLKYRLEKWRPSLIIYEVGIDQTLYFEQLFEAAEMLSWTKGVRLVHIGHGLIRWPWGKFSTRKGETIHLEEVLNLAISKAKGIIDKSETKRNLSEKEKESAARKIGISAVKYNILSYHYKSDIIFDWEKILNLEGNSGPYLQYTLVRCLSILDKAEHLKLKESLSFNPNHLEYLICRQIAIFKSTLDLVQEKNSLNLLTDYAYKLASLYNLFYQKYQILKAESKEEMLFRLKLTQATSQILKIVFKILGLDILTKM